MGSVARYLRRDGHALTGASFLVFVALEERCHMLSANSQTHYMLNAKPYPPTLFWTKGNPKADTKGRQKAYQRQTKGRPKADQRQSKGRLRAERRESKGRPEAEQRHAKC